MKKNIIILIVAAIALAGCSDFLDIRTEGFLPSSGIDYSKPENIFLPVSAAYASMRLQEGEAQNYIAVLEVPSDDADKGSSEADGPTVAEFDNFTYGPGNNHISAVWTIFYNIVSAANYAIESMDLYKEAITSEDGLLQVEQCRGEAKVIRAYAYWNLVRLFGTVPLIDKTMSATDLASVGVSSKADLYKFIYKDLDEAIEVLPNSFPDYKSRYNKYTALALKSKVALYNGDWKEAARCADLVIASGRYSLMSRFSDAFSVEGENGPECIMEVESSALRQTSDPLPINYYAFIQGPRGNKEPFQGWGYKVPSATLIGWLDGRGDAIRRKVTVLERGANETDEISSNCINPYYNGKVYTPREWNTRSYNAYGLEHNQRLIRYADVLLIFAEAMVNGAGIAPESGYTADQALNEVRNRAGLAPVAATLDNILDERRAELALEENRFFDLVRTGKALAVLGPLGYTAKNEVFPIPSAQMELNPNLPRTPGYTY
jgi:hypothetical protein